MSLNRLRLNIIFVLLQNKIVLYMANKDINRIKVILVDKKKTKKWQAEELGKWCTNTSQPDLESLMKISQLLGVEISELVRFEHINEDKTNKEEKND